jgi:hypothetical protein
LRNPSLSSKLQKPQLELLHETRAGIDQRREYLHERGAEPYCLIGVLGRPDAAHTNEYEA